MGIGRAGTTMTLWSSWTMTAKPTSLSDSWNWNDPTCRSITEPDVSPAT